MKSLPKKSSAYCGVTLIELMIALVVSSVVLLGVATVYFSSKRAYKVQEEMSRLQENVRFGFEEVTRELRRTGYLGYTPSCKNHLRNDTIDSLNIFDGISGFEYIGFDTKPGADFTITSLTLTGSQGDWAGPDGDDPDADADNLPAWLAGRVLAGNDLLILHRFAKSNGICSIDTGSFNSTSASLPLTGNCPVAKGAIVVVNDGINCDVFQNITNANSSTLSRGVAVGTLIPGNNTPNEEDWSIEPKPLPGGGGSNTSILVDTYSAYYVGIGASGEPALFRADFNDPYTDNSAPSHQEIIEGVENLQILYGIDNNPNDDNFQPDQYVTADPSELSSFRNVVSVRVSMLMRTPQEMNRPVQASTHRLLGVTNATGVDVTTMADRRIRKVVTTTIFLRNKGLYREEPGAQR